jgi:hypothetical protein
MSNWLERANEFIRLIDPPYRGDELDEYIYHVYEAYRNNSPTPPSIHERITLSKYREGIAYERKRSFEEQREYIASEWMGQGKGSEVSPSKDRRTFCVGEATYDWDETTKRYELRPKRSWLSRFLEFMKWK